MLKNKLLSAMGGAPANYIEDVFSTYLYTGNGTSQTITNGIDLAGKGGLVWIKSRAGTYVREHYLYDTARGTILSLSTDTTGGNLNNSPNGVTAFNSDGFTALGPLGAGLTASGTTYASWTFRKQPKFFDVVTYTGDGVAGRTIAHSLGSVPGMIIVKRTNGVSDWNCWHRSISTGDLTLNTLIQLNTTSAASGAVNQMGVVSSTSFEIGSNASFNGSGSTYVAYLFAHNAGGFGLTGTDNVISCGSFTTSAGGGDATVSLGYEPQWVLIKKTSSTGDWTLVDTMRGMSNLGTYGDASFLRPNLANAESTGANAYPTTTGFYYAQSASSTYIYIAIRRGPMKTPTSGTSVFAPIVSTASTGTALTTGFPVDMQFPIALAPTYTIANAVDRLRGVSSTTTASGLYLEQSNTNAEASGTVTRNWGNTGFQFPDYFATLKTLFLNFRRAPGFMDVCCYTGTGSARTVAHNLTVVPELMIVKNRSTLGSFNEWIVYHSALGATKALKLNETSVADTYSGYWNNTAPTTTQFTVGAPYSSSGATYVAYLFASCPGVSKCFSYTGNGSSQTINCGFTGGARFVMVKRTDSTGNWMVVDTARGLVSAGDPTLYLNSAAAEVTGVDWIDPDSSGFIVNQEGTMNANVNGATYIGLAVA